MKLISKNSLALVCITACVILLSSCGRGETKMKELSYHGIKFSHPDYWKTEVEDLGNGSYYMSCEEPFSENLFMVTFIEGELDSEERIIDYFDIMKKQNNFSSTKSVPGKFNGIDCLTATYEFSVLRSKALGIVYSFNHNGKSVLVVVNSDKKYDLRDKFTKIQASFVVEGGDEDAADVIETEADSLRLEI